MAKRIKGYVMTADKMIKDSTGCDVIEADITNGYTMRIMKRNTRTEVYMVISKEVLLERGANGSSYKFIGINDKSGDLYIDRQLDRVQYNNILKHYKRRFRAMNNSDIDSRYFIDLDSNHNLYVRHNIYFRLDFDNKIIEQDSL